MPLEGQEPQDVARELVARTCAAQGIPEKITDPVVLRRVAAILLSSRASVKRPA